MKRMLKNPCILFCLILSGSLPILAAGHLRFAEFVRQHDPSGDLHAQSNWYEVTLTYASLDETPPAGTFIVDAIPPNIQSSARTIRVNITSGHAHHYLNASHILRDPLGFTLTKPFIFGEEAYLLLKNDNPQNLDLALHLYTSQNVNWEPGKPRQACTYTLDEQTFDSEIEVGTGQWFVMVQATPTNTSAGAYSYLFVKIETAGVKH